MKIDFDKELPQAQSVHVSFYEESYSDDHTEMDFNDDIIFDSEFVSQSEPTVC